MSILQETREIIDLAVEVYRGSFNADRLATIQRRLEQPLRVAIAGRVKSGKSTLLNALIGERLATTDAGECTRIVTSYREGHMCRIWLHPRQGQPWQPHFTRDEGAIEVDLDGLAADQVDEIDVMWPSQALHDVTFIDTPGIGSLSDSVATRSWDLLAQDDRPADAVLYLLRHVHPQDLEFLHAFHDGGASGPNPVNAIALLSRADEVGVGRLDAMGSARRIAQRIARDSTVRSVVQTVVPVAGLLAETAATVTELEVAHLRLIARLPPAELERLLLSTDRFLSRASELDLGRAEREHLLRRFGVFGIRVSASLLSQGVVSTASQLARELLDRSGLDDLTAILRVLFLERSEVLKCRSALLGVDAIARAHPRQGSDAVVAAVERVIASAHPFEELRTLAAIRAGWVTARPQVLDDLEYLIGGAGTAFHVRLQLPADVDVDTLRAAAGSALNRWQRHAESPLTDQDLAVAARVALRSCEGMLAQLTQQTASSPYQ
jgi:hypothetical protein